MEEEQLVDPADPDEALDRVVKTALRSLLTDETMTAVVLAVEEAKAADLAARVADLTTTEEVEGIAEVLRRVASVGPRVCAEELEPLVKGEDLTGDLKLIRDRPCDRGDPLFRR